MLRAASRFYAAQQERALLTVKAGRAEWFKLSKPDGFDRIADRLLALAMAAQLGAAEDGAAYTTSALAEQGYRGDSPLKVNPASFTGWATSLNEPEMYRPLESLLWLTPSQAASQGGTLAEQMARGGQFLATVLHSQIADAGRLATGVGIAARPGTDWVRHVSPPCCQQCAVLAGKRFRSNQGFQRHHGCDCVHVPCHSSDIPEGYTDTVTPDQIHDLTEAQRKALDEGADLSQVVNAYRGLSPSQRAKMGATLEGTTRRGYASYLRRAIDREQGRRTVETAVKVGPRGVVRNYTERRIQRRLSPEGIYRIARNEDEARLLLIKNGYIVGDIRKLARTATAEMRRIAAATP